MWMEAFNLARVLVALEWRQAGSVYYPPDFREVPTTLPPPLALAPKTSEQPLTTQAPLPPSEASKGSSQVGDQGQVIEVAKDKDKGKDAKVAAKAKGAAIKAKEAEDKNKEADLKVKDALAPQPSKKEDPTPPAKA